MGTKWESSTELSLGNPETLEARKWGLLRPAGSIALALEHRQPTISGGSVAMLGSVCDKMLNGLSLSPLLEHRAQNHEMLRLWRERRYWLGFWLLHDDG